jgi:hypothetical protein
MRSVSWFPRTAALAVLAAAACADRSADDRIAVRAIEEELLADGPAARATAAAKLADLFPEGADAVPMLIDLLDDESPDVVAAAARAIDSMALAGAPRITAWCADPGRFDGADSFGTRMEGFLSLFVRSPRDVFEEVHGEFEPMTAEIGAQAAVADWSHPPHDLWWRDATRAAFRRADGEANGPVQCPTRRRQSRCPAPKGRLNWSPGRSPG